MGQGFGRGMLALGLAMVGACGEDGADDGGEDGAVELGSLGLSAEPRCGALMVVMPTREEFHAGQIDTLTLRVEALGPAASVADGTEVFIGTDDPRSTASGAFLSTRERILSGQLDSSEALDHSSGLRFQAGRAQDEIFCLGLGDLVLQAETHLPEGRVDSGRVTVRCVSRSTFNEACGLPEPDAAVEDDAGLWPDAGEPDAAPRPPPGDAGGERPM